MRGYNKELRENQSLTQTCHLRKKKLTGKTIQKMAENLKGLTVECVVMCAKIQSLIGKGTEKGTTSGVVKEQLIRSP